MLRFRKIHTHTFWTQTNIHPDGTSYQNISSHPLFNFTLPGLDKVRQGLVLIAPLPQWAWSCAAQLLRLRNSEKHDLPLMYRRYVLQFA